MTMRSIPDNIDTRMRDARIAWDAVKDAQAVAERAIKANTLTGETASRLAKAMQDYLAALDKLVLRT